MINSRLSSSSAVAPKLVRNIDQKILIGTLGVNCLQYTRRCIETVVSRAKQVDFLYIDNGSKPENVEQIKKWKKKNENIDGFFMAFNGCNAGVAVGWNQIIRYGIANGYDKIIVCNNDIAFGLHTIDGLIESFDRLRKEIPETVMVTATNHTKNPADLKSIPKVWKYQEHPDFSCFMITPEFVERMGEICEDYKPAFFEDNDTHWRILMSGYKAFSSDFAPYSHIASRTRHENPNIVTHEMFRKNKIKFCQNMRALTVDQNVPVARYDEWLKRNPEVKHPKVEDVLEMVDRDLSSSFRATLAKLTVENVPI